MVSTGLTRARRSQAALALDPIPASKVQSGHTKLQNLTSTTDLSNTQKGVLAGGLANVVGWMLGLPGVSVGPSLVGISGAFRFDFNSLSELTGLSVN
jgi:hypothetical protein